MDEKEFKELKKRLEELMKRLEDLEEVVERIEHAVMMELQGQEKTDVQRDALLELVAALAERDARHIELLELMRQRMALSEQQHSDLIAVVTTQVPAAVAQYADRIEARVIADYEWTKQELRRPLPRTRVQNDPLEDAAAAVRAEQDAKRGRD